MSGVGGRDWELFNEFGQEFQLCKMKRVLDMGGGDGCKKNVNVLNANELYI